MVNITCESPFEQMEVEELKKNADMVILRYFPWAKEEFAKRGWSLSKSIDRVYVIKRRRSFWDITLA